MIKLIIKEVQKLIIDKLKENNIEEYNLKAKMLICNAIDKPKEYLITHDTEVIDDSKVIEITNDTERVVEGYPIQYITNKQEFMGLNFYVDENVLIPQPDTEILVEEVLNIANKMDNFKILDLCTGSGAIAVALKKHIHSECHITASDISKKALNVANTNAKDNNTEIEFIESDLFEKIEGRYNIIVSNPPYIKTNVIKDLSVEVQNEPHLALDGGKDGLVFYKEIISNAYKYLETNGILALEIGYDQKSEVEQIIEISNEYKEIYSKKDLAGNDRIVVSKRR